MSSVQQGSGGDDAVATGKKRLVLVTTNAKVVDAGGLRGKFEPGKVYEFAGIELAAAMKTGWFAAEGTAEADDAVAAAAGSLSA